MIDIQLLRKDPAEVARRLAGRGPGAFDAGQFQQFETVRKNLQTAVEQAQASRNRIAKDIGQAKAKGHDVTDLLVQGEKLKSLLEESEQQLAKLQSGFQDFLGRIPNIPHESVPLGDSAEQNREERRWGEPRQFDFPVKDHVDIGEALGGLDFATAAKIAGSRFYVMRGSLARLHRVIGQFMLDGGGDPLYVGRRVVRMAIEDIGLADPQSLRLALDACETYERLGSPEGELALAEAVIYLALAPKSNAVYEAYNAARDFISRDGTRPVPLHIRNAPTKLMKQLGYGKDYRYAHEEQGAYAAGENYFPEGMPAVEWYKPTERGREARLRERIAEMRQLDAEAAKKR